MAPQGEPDERGELTVSETQKEPRKLPLVDEPSPGPALAPAADATEVSSFRMVAAMGLIGLVSGVLIVAAYQLTLPTILKNKARALEKAVLNVVPGARSRVAFRVAGAKLVLMEKDDLTATRVFACYDAQKKLVGVAVEAQGQGFQDTIKLIYGYSPACDCVVGMMVLESKETPGLGDKIETDENFKANFKKLEVKVAADGKSIRHPIELAKAGKKDKPFQIEAITGATISSRAITKILAASTKTIVPIIRRNLTVLLKGKR